MKQNQLLHAGAAFFGSKEPAQLYADKVQDIVKTMVKKGMAITTGGSGGLMNLANSTAKKEKGHSIGIPYGETREVAANYLHDLTIPTQGYEERIPLILQDKNFVIVGPGGSGTMKELATTFVQIGSGVEHLHPHLIFIGRSYYENLARFILKVLPPFYLDRMTLVDKPEELNQYMKELSLIPTPNKQ